MLAELLPWLRGQVSRQKRFIATVQSDPAILRFVNSQDAPRLAELGTSCPDHFLRTKIKPLYVDWNPQAEGLDALKAKLTAGLEQYRKDYAAYYQACRRADSPGMRDPNPTVMLIPGIGMIAWGKDKSESRVTAEFYNCAVEVMRGAEAIDEYIALPQQEAFDIEYWQLEEAKLKRMPPENVLARRVVVVAGAGNGIGKAVGIAAGQGRRARSLRGSGQRRGRGDGAGAGEHLWRRDRGCGHGHFGMRPSHWMRGECDRPRQRPRNARAGGARLRRNRPYRCDRRRVHTARSQRPRQRRVSGDSPST